MINISNKIFLYIRLIFLLNLNCLTIFDIFQIALCHTMAVNVIKDVLKTVKPFVLRIVVIAILVSQDTMEINVTKTVLWNVGVMEHVNSHLVTVIPVSLDIMVQSVTNNVLVAVELTKVVNSSLDAAFHVLLVSKEITVTSLVVLAV